MTLDPIIRDLRQGNKGLEHALDALGHPIPSRPAPCTDDASATAVGRAVVASRVSYASAQLRDIVARLLRRD